MITHSLRVIGGLDGESIQINYDEDSSECLLTAICRNLVFRSTSSDYFEAFCEIRRQLEAQGLIPHCFGSSLNVFPSSMARDMGLGLKAYRMTMGHHADRKDLVNIFETDEKVIPASVDDQFQWYQNWLSGPRR